MESTVGAAKYDYDNAKRFVVYNFTRTETQKRGASRAGRKYEILEYEIKV
jgi:hypothetical protein